MHASLKNKVTYISRIIRDAGRSIIGGAGLNIFIYSCYAQLISFEIEIEILKSIVLQSVNKNI